MCLKENYKKVGLPMLQVLKGNAVASRQIVVYAGWTVLTSLVLLFGQVGIIYAVSALFLGTLFILKAVKLGKTSVTAEAGRLFGYSITYLLALFVALIVDSLMTFRL